MSENKFLPICKKDMEERGWEQLDFVYISGDAYVDHPSFGAAWPSVAASHSGRRHHNQSLCGRAYRAAAEPASAFTFW